MHHINDTDIVVWDISCRYTVNEGSNVLSNVIILSSEHAAGMRPHITFCSHMKTRSADRSNISHFCGTG